MPDTDVDASTLADDVVYMLTTEDNPYSPFDEFHQWWVWDETSEHHTCGLLARYTVTSTELPDWMQDEARYEAMDQIIEEAIHARFKKVSREDYPNVKTEVPEI